MIEDRFHIGGRESRHRDRIGDEAGDDRREHDVDRAEIAEEIGTAAAVPGAIIPVVCVSAAGMLAFELFIIYKFWLSSRDYSRSLAKLNGTIEGYRAQLPAEEPEHSADAAVVGSSG